MPTRTVTLNIIGESSGATRALGQTAAEGEKTAGRISGAFRGMFGVLSGTGALGPLQDVFNNVDNMLSQLQEHGKTVGKTLMGIGAGAAGVGMLGSTLGSGDKAAQQQLAQAIQNTGHDIADYKDQIDKAVKSQERFGNTEVQTKNALQTLTQATGDPAKALKYIGVASDLAAAQHMALGDAATKVAQILEGKGTRTLTMFGLAQQKHVDYAKQEELAAKNMNNATAASIAAEAKLSDLQTIQASKRKLTISDHIALQNAMDRVSAAHAKEQAATQAYNNVLAQASAAGKNHTAVIDQLAAKLQGQASASANTFTGKIRALKAEIEDHVTQLGQKYGPAITAAGVGMSALGSSVEMASGIMGKFRTVQEAGTAATEAMTAAEAAEVPVEGAALGPILLIVAAIAALGVGIYELVTHWKAVWGAIKDAVGIAFAAVKTAISSVINWLQTNWPLVLGILTGPIGLAVYFIARHWQDIIDFITGLPAKLASAGAHLWDWMWDGMKAVINLIIGGWDFLASHSEFTLPKLSIGPVHLGGEHVGPFLPTIPKLDAGGIAMGAVLALVAESRPEAIVPLAELPDLMGKAMLAAQRQGPGAVAASAGQPAPVNVYVETGADPWEIGREVAWAQRFSTVAA